MRNVMIYGLAAAALGALTVGPAAALPASQSGMRGDAPNVRIEQVQYRRHFRGHRYGYRGGWRRGHRYYHGGVGAGLAGLAAGAVIGGAIANSQAPAYYDVAPTNGGAEAYCEQRFRSYDPASGTYLGYDGERHPCP